MDILEALGEVFKNGEKLKEKHPEISGDNTDNIFVNAFYSLGGGKVIEKLQNHKDIKVYEKVEKLIDSYFETDDK